MPKVAPAMLPRFPLHVSWPPFWVALRSDSAPWLSPTTGMPELPLLWAELQMAAQDPATVEPKPLNQDERPPRPAHFDVATPAQEAQAERMGQVPVTAPRPAPPEFVRASDPGPMPPASAGSNGSYTPRPRSEDKKTTPELEPGSETGSRGTARSSSTASRSPRRAPQSESRRRSPPRTKSSIVHICGAAATPPGTRPAMTAPGRSATRSARVGSFRRPSTRAA